MAPSGNEPRREKKAAWTKLFTAFRVALDIKKLLLAAAGILLTACGWWVLSFLFYSAKPPQWSDYEGSKLLDSQKMENFLAFKAARRSWNLLHELAATGPIAVDEEDVAETWEELDLLKKIREALANSKKPEGDQPEDEKKKKIREEADAFLKSQEKTTLDKYKKFLGNSQVKEGGKMRTLPWFEDRGPNPYLLVVNNFRHPDKREKYWGKGEFLSWFLTEEIPVLLEPVVKFLTPVIYFFHPDVNFLGRIYLILSILWMVAVWGLFGGAITRIAVVEIAKNEKVGLREAIDFAKTRFLGYFAAPAFPLALLLGLTGILWVFGMFVGHTYWLGDILGGILWIIALVITLVMAVVLLGLGGWPLMNPVISAEGSDSFDALSRSYSYIYQAPWQYLWYWLVALSYGMVLVFFITFMGSMMVYLSKWGVGKACYLRDISYVTKKEPDVTKKEPDVTKKDADVKPDFSRDRDPVYFFVNTPTSFGWRNLVLKDSDAYVVKSKDGDLDIREDYKKSMSWANHTGAFFVTVWVWLLFLLVVGFGYSYFWTASSIIYFLMRNHVDDTDMDEVHLDEDPAGGPAPTIPMNPPPTIPSSKPNAIGLPMVNPPANPAPPPPVSPPPGDSGSPPMGH